MPIGKQRVLIAIDHNSPRSATKAPRCVTGIWGAGSMSDAKDTDAEASPEVEDLAPWVRNRRLRQAALDAANAHGAQLAERYGREQARPGFAAVGRVNTKRRRL